jgi:membrane protein insertase Oxa1/YidC/SpoIIIJ
MDKMSVEEEKIQAHDFYEWNFQKQLLWATWSSGGVGISIVVVFIVVIIVIVVLVSKEGGTMQKVKS